MTPEEQHQLLINNPPENVLNDGSRTEDLKWTRALTLVRRRMAATAAPQMWRHDARGGRQGALVEMG